MLIWFVRSLNKKCKSLTTSNAAGAILTHNFPFDISSRMEICFSISIQILFSKQKLSLPARYDDKYRGATSSSSKRGLSPSRRTLHFLDGLQHIFQSNQSHSKHNSSTKTCNGDLSPVVIVAADDFAGEDASASGRGCLSRSSSSACSISRTNSCNNPNDILCQKTSICSSSSSSSRSSFIATTGDCSLKSRHSRIESKQNVTRIVIKAEQQNEMNGKLLLGIVFVLFWIFFPSLMAHSDDLHLFSTSFFVVVFRCIFFLEYFAIRL